MQRGDIFLINLNKAYGSIQSGIRPAIIIQNNIGNQYSPTTIICCITTAKKKHLPTHLYISKSGGLKKNSIVLCEQLFTINKKDLIKYIGTIKNKRTLNRLNRCIKISLGIKEN